MVLTALTMSALFLVAGLSVDLGRVWTEKRALVTASDAAALAAAHSLAAGGSDGCSTAASYVAFNTPQATMSRCTITLNGASGGQVMIEASDIVDYSFARVAGFDSQSVSSATTVTWGSNLATGLRPFAFCEFTNAELQAWLANPTTAKEIKFSFTNAANVPACSANGSAPGNWGFVDFDGGSNSDADIRDWISGGYPGSVVTTSSSNSCSQNSAGCYDGSPGALSGSHKSALQSLVDSGQAFPTAIFTTAEGNGANLQMKMTKVASAKLVDFEATGQQSKRYLTLEFQPNLLQDGDPDSTVRLCSVSRIDNSNC